jgi:hypothetical protein
VQFALSRNDYLAKALISLLVFRHLKVTAMNFSPFVFISLPSGFSRRVNKIEEAGFSQISICRVEVHKRGVSK